MDVRWQLFGVDILFPDGTLRLCTVYLGMRSDRHIRLIDIFPGLCIYYYRRSDLDLVVALVRTCVF